MSVLFSLPMSPTTSFEDTSCLLLACSGGLRKASHPAARERLPFEDGTHDEVYTKFMSRRFSVLCTIFSVLVTPSIPCLI